jgi:hypothetical protein
MRAQRATGNAVAPRRSTPVAVAAQACGDQQDAPRTATAAPSRPGFGWVITCTAMRRM